MYPEEFARYHRVTLSAGILTSLLKKCIVLIFLTIVGLKGVSSHVSRGQRTSISELLGT